MPLGAVRRVRWLASVLLALVAIIGMLDVVLPPDFVVLPFLVIPVVGSIALGSERFTFILLAEAFTFTAISSSIHHYSPSDNATRVLSFGFAAAVSALLARELRRQRAFGRVMLDAGLEPVMLLRAVRDASGAIVDFRFVDANPAACIHYRRSQEALIGVHLRAIADPAFIETGLFDRYRETLLRDGRLNIEAMHYPSPSGDGERYLDIRGRRLEGDLLYVTWRDVSEQVALRDELHRRATSDDLTGALQRDASITRVDRLLRRPHHEGMATAAIFIDLDDFKHINDVQGHAAGDAVLAEFVRRARRHVRDSDIVARLGGDEFLVVLPEVRQAGDALAVAEKIRASAAEPIPGCGCVVTVSIGVAMATPGETVDDLVARADAAMFSAKGAGRDRVVLVDA